MLLIFSLPRQSPGLLIFEAGDHLFKEAEIAVDTIRIVGDITGQSKLA
jgi:hypothetical protein